MEPSLQLNQNSSGHFKKERWIEKFDEKFIGWGNQWSNLLSRDRSLSVIWSVFPWRDYQIVWGPAHLIWFWEGRELLWWKASWSWLGPGRQNMSLALPCLRPGSHRVITAACPTMYWRNNVLKEDHGKYLHNSNSLSKSCLEMRLLGGRSVWKGLNPLTVDLTLLMFSRRFLLSGYCFPFILFSLQGPGFSSELSLNCGYLC